MQVLRIRFPDSVKDYLSVRAKDNDRSMNAELNNIMKKVMKAERSASEIHADNNADLRETIAGTLASWGIKPQSDATDENGEVA